MGDPGIGLLAGIVPSALTRSTFPARVALSWLFAAFAASPVVMNNVPSGANPMIPPLCTLPPGGENHRPVGGDPDAPAIVHARRRDPIEDDFHSGRTRRYLWAEPEPHNSVHIPTEGPVEVRVVRVNPGR